MPMMKKKSRSRRRHDKEPSPAPTPTRPFQKSIPFDELPKEQCMFYTVLIGRVRQVMREGDCVTLILQDHRGKLHVKCTGEKQVEFVEQLNDSHVIKIHHALVNRVKAAAFCHNDTNSEFLLWEMRLGDVESPLALVRTSDESLEVLDKDVIEACHLTKWVQQREANKAKKKREEEEKLKQRREKVSQALSLDSPPRSQSTPLRQQQVEGSERVGGVTEPVPTVDGNHENQQQIVAEYDDDIFSPSEDSDSGENISTVVNNNKDDDRHRQMVQDNTISQFCDNTTSQSVSLLVQDNTMSPMVQERSQLVQENTMSQLVRVRDNKMSHLVHDNTMSPMVQERSQLVQDNTMSQLVRVRDDKMSRLVQDNTTSQLVQDNTMSQLVQEMSQMVQDNTMSQSMSQLALEATMSTDEEDSTDHILEDMEQFLFDPGAQKPKVDQAAVLREKYFEMRRQREEAEQRRNMESGEGEGFPSANICDGQASAGIEQEGDGEEERSREDREMRECVQQGDEEDVRRMRECVEQGDEESGRPTRECVEQGDNDAPIEENISETVVKEEVREPVEETTEEIVVVENLNHRKGVSILEAVQQIVKEDIRDGVEERDEEEQRNEAEVGEHGEEVREHVEERDEGEMREHVETRNEEEEVREREKERHEEEMRENVEERNEDEVGDHVEERNEEEMREHVEERKEGEMRERVESRDEEEITDHVDDSIHEEHVEETTESGDTEMNTASADDAVRDNRDARVSRDIEKRESAPMEETQTDESGEDAVLGEDAEKQRTVDGEIEEEKEVDSLNSTTRGSTVDTIDEKPGTVVVMDRFKDFKEKFSNALANAHFRGMKEAEKLKLPLDFIISQRSPFSQCMDKVFEFNVGDTVHLMHWLDVDQSLMNPKWMEKCVVVDADCPQCGRCYPLATPLCPQCWAAFLPTQATAPTVLSKTMKGKRRIRFAREYANGAGGSDETSCDVPSVNVATTRVLIPCRFETDVTSRRKGVPSIGLAVFAMPVSYFANLFPERPAFAKVLSYVQGPEWNTAASIPVDLQLEVGYAVRLYLVMHRFLVARGTLMAKRLLDSTVVVHVTDCRLKKIPLNEITVCGKPLQI